MDTRSSPMFPFIASRFRRRVARVSQHLNDLHSTIAAIEEREYSLMTAIQHFAEVADNDVFSKRSGKRPKSRCEPSKPNWSALEERENRLEKALDYPHSARNLVFCIRQLRSFENESPADPYVGALSLRQRANRASKSCSSESQTQSSAVRGNYSCNMAFAWSFGTVPHGLLVLLLPHAFAAPYLTPQGAHHHHPNHGNPELHAKPNGIQCVHRPPPLTTGCTPIRSRCPISR
jgi:hypothetical protein